MVEIVPKQKTDKNGSVRVSFTISDCPLPLYRIFSNLAKSYYNDMYWVTLQDLYRKSEAYELLLGGGEEPQKEEKKVEIVKGIGE